MTKVLKNKKGFTLIEIIAVLVILGILAAVAIPKFISLIADSKTKAAEAAVAEGVAQVNQYAAKHILANGTVPTTLAQLVTAGLTDPYTQGDFSIDFAQGTGASVDIVATGKTGTNVDGATSPTKNVPLPQ